MFLSQLISRYEEDGSLVVDLGDEDGPLLRFGPFAAGMPWERRAGEAWVGTAFDWGARLVNRAHGSRRDLPVNHYLRPWPRDLVRDLDPVWYAQATLMQLCARYPAARDLARSNLALLWLVAARYAEDAGWRRRLPGVLTLRRRHLLAEVRELPEVRPAQIRFLRKISIMEGTMAQYRHLWASVADERTVMALRFPTRRRGSAAAPASLAALRSGVHRQPLPVAGHAASGAPAAAAGHRAHARALHPGGHRRAHCHLLPGLGRHAAASRRPAGDGGRGARDA